MTEDEFVFLGSFGKELGRVRRHDVDEVAFSDRSQVTQRLSATRLLLLGPLAFAAPKKGKHQEYCMLVSWTDATGVPKNAVFSFEGALSQALANKAVDRMRTYIKPKPIKEG